MHFPSIETNNVNIKVQVNHWLLLCSEEIFYKQRCFSLSEGIFMPTEQKRHMCVCQVIINPNSCINFAGSKPGGDASHHTIHTLCSHHHHPIHKLREKSLLFYSVWKDCTLMFMRCLKVSLLSLNCCTSLKPSKGRLWAAFYTSKYTIPLDSQYIEVGERANKRKSMRKIITCFLPILSFNIINFGFIFLLNCCVPWINKATKLLCA